MDLKKDSWRVVYEKGREIIGEHIRKIVKVKSDDIRINVIN